MAREDKKTLLIVEDDPYILEGYKIALERKYKITPVFYPNEAIPREYYDLAMLDGLNGDCIDVAKRIKSGKTIVISGDPCMLQKAEENGLITEKKPISHDKLEEMLG